MIRSDADDSGWNSDSSGSSGYVRQYDGIGSDFCVLADKDVPQYLRARSHVHVAFKDRGTVRSATKRHLLKQQAVGADRRARMDDDTGGVRKQETATELAI
jgi:hypothetical protein